MIKRLPVLLLLVVGALCGRILSPHAAELIFVNSVAVVVNDVPITYQQVEEEVVEEEQVLRRTYARRPDELRGRLEKLRQDAVDLLVERQLILKEFQTAGYQLPESIIDEHIKSTVRERFGDRLRLIRTLQKQGITYEAYKKQLKEDFIIRAMTARHVGDEILISPYKVESYYRENIDRFKVEDQVRLRMMTFLNRARDAAETRKLAEEVLAKLEGGADFAELARLHSEDSYRNQGGDRDWVGRNVMRADLSEVAFALKKGERSGVIERPEGCYLMWAEDVRSAHTRTLAEVRSEIEGALRVQEQQRARKRWIDRLKAKSYIYAYARP